jgi:3-oxoacyl-(acyl-carrier-protein) synthase
MSPFARDRNGIVLAEGAVFLALEREEVNHSRNGKRYARLGGVASASDAFSFYRNDPTGRGFQLAIENCLEASGLGLGDIEVILAAASGQDQLDRAESAGIRSVWGERSREVPVTALKGVLGDIGAATSLLVCALGCEIFRRGIIPATVPVREVDPEFALNLVQAPQERAVETILVNEASWGGLYASAILQRAS